MITQQVQSTTYIDIHSMRYKFTIQFLDESFARSKSQGGFERGLSYKISFHIMWKFMWTYPYRQRNHGHTVYCKYIEMVSLDTPKKKINAK